MRRLRIGFGALALFLAVCASKGYTQSAGGTAADELGSTSWQLVQFQGGDGHVLTPDSKAKYTVAFGRNNDVGVRIDCNRGHGTWKSSGANQIEFGGMALTTAMCQSAAVGDRLPKDLTYVRSYTLRNGHLFLSLMADGGTYEFEPLAPETMTGTVKGTATYRERMALPANAVFEATLQDVSRADAAGEVIGRIRVENPGNPPIAFAISYPTNKIDPSHTYSVRARIVAADNLMFTTTQSYPVVTGGRPSEVSLLLRRASGSALQNKAASPSFPARLPASFAGTIPCADCPGIRYQVNLLADGRFDLRMTYAGRNTSYDDHGKWEITGDGTMLVLHGSSKGSERFSVRDGDTLRKLDADDHEIESKLNYELKRLPEFASLPPEGDKTPPLENTDWKLIRLASATISSPTQQQEPYLHLDPENHRVSGSGGCNRVMGSYESRGDTITFSQMASTMMACVKGMDTEKAFMTALGQVKKWRITKQQLELLDASGNVLARFQPRGK